MSSPAYHHKYYIKNKKKLQDRRRIRYIENHAHILLKMKEYRTHNHDNIIEYKNKYRQTNPQKVSISKTRSREKLRLEVLRYSSKLVCACCSEGIVRFLCLDHINNDGNKHREEIGPIIYGWIKKNKFPSGFQVLCYNCNVGRYLNGGVCPHKQQNRSIGQNQ